MKKITVILLLISISGFAQTLKSLPNWHNLDFEKDGVMGMSTEKAYELLKGRKSKTVVVAIIDSGIDIQHEDLKSVIWTNPKEIAGNGIDDDKNGFVDDINGWDFIGGADGKDVGPEQIEIVRLYNDLKIKFGEKPKKRKIRKNKADYERMLEFKKQIDAKRDEATQYLPMYKNMMEQFTKTSEVLSKALGKSDFTDEEVEKIDESQVERNVRAAKQAYFGLKKMGVSKSDLEEGLKQLDEQLNYNYNLDYNPRKIVGDNPTLLEYGKYGNAEVTGPDAEHGTHVAGIIGANRTNNIGVTGVADNVKIMVIRCVPNGDERDKDVANAIRYAADNGAEIVNMSFGKAESPQKNWVDEAALYAQSKGVLLISAAGNDGQNIDEKKTYPSRKTTKNETVKSWISVGANGYTKDEKLPANFSNYGKTAVDVFAPGVAIYSSVVGSKYKEHDGTSMASPACVGVAALIKSYFPSLTAIELKEIIMASATKISGLEVKKPGGEGNISFTDLSQTGGVVNAYNAVKMAIEKTEGKK
jgi:subtilisin family serine protease